MSCCGKKREQFRLKDDSPAYFQYTGKTGLTVIGPKTHKRYRFDNPGAIITVDPRDKYALAAVPSLREVEKSQNVTKEF